MIDGAQSRSGGFAMKRKMLSAHVSQAQWVARQHGIADGPRTMAAAKVTAANAVRQRLAHRRLDPCRWFLKGKAMPQQHGCGEDRAESQGHRR